MFKKTLFGFLARANKVVLPSFATKDLTRLSKMQKALVAYRYWVTIHSLD